MLEGSHSGWSKVKCDGLDGPVLSYPSYGRGDGKGNAEDTVGLGFIERDKPDLPCAVR